MKTTLDIFAAWTALDVVLIAAWHLLHVRSRRLGAAHLVTTGPATQRVYTLAPEVGVRDIPASPFRTSPFRTSPLQTTLVQAGRG